MRRHSAAGALVILLALAALACSGIPFLQAAPTTTPTPTSTATPRPTSTSTATATQTPAPTATLPSSGTTRTLPDGSIEVTDAEGRFRLVLPPQWLVLDLGAEDLEQAMEAASEMNPEFAPLISGFGAVAAQGMSLIAMELDPQAVAAGYPTNFVVVAIPGMGMSLDFVVEATALSLEGMFQGSELISYEMIDDLNGSPAGRIDMRMPLTTMTGSAITVRSTWILMEAGDELIEFTVQAESAQYAQDEAQLEAVIQSIELIGE
jgi:hypothetical protein